MSITRFSLTLLLSLSVALSCLRAEPERPSAKNTGPTTPVSELRKIGSVKITKDGTVLENFRLVGDIRIEANNVTIRNFSIDGGSAWYGIQIISGSGTLIEDGEITRTKSAAIVGSRFTARRLHIHHVGKDAIKVGSHVTVESCYIHHVGDPGVNPDVHADGIQSVGGSNVLIRWNNIDMPSGQDGYLNHHAIIIQAQNREVDNVRIEENWLNGGGYTVQLRSKKGGSGGEPTNCHIAGNSYGRDWRHGPWHTSGEVLKYDNVYLSSGSLLPGQSSSTSLPSGPSDLSVTSK